MIYYPSQKVGSWLPGTKILSTLSLVTIASLIVPPEDPSLDIANEIANLINKYNF